MTQTDHIQQYWPEVLELLGEGENNDAIIAHLHKKGVDEATITALVDLIRKERYAIRRRRGVKLMLAGAVMLLLGFIITLAFVYSDKSIDYVMYGMTTVGIIIFLWGVVEVLGF
ncbi:MAG: hypothetical protein MUC87_07870 [Bacteroidia bacterium]|jgi:hypothetical protein|nr:hypothetical protein [Bacteroidia bacterium]